MQQYDLVVRSPFQNYKRGDRITDQSVVSEVLNSENEHNVVRVLPEQVKG